MDTNTCSNCRGEGLVGSGDQPWLRIGHLTTCKQCNGTGSSKGASDKEAVETAHANDVQDNVLTIGVYKITGEAPYTDEQGSRKGVLDIGSVHKLPISAGDAFVASGVAEKVADDTPTDEQSYTPDTIIEKAVDESTDGVPVEGAGAVDEEHATMDTTQTATPRG